MSHCIWVNDFEPMIVNQWIWGKCLGEVSGGSFWGKFLSFWISEFMSFWISASLNLNFWCYDFLNPWNLESELMNLNQWISAKGSGGNVWGKFSGGSFLWEVFGGSFWFFEFLNVWISEFLNFWNWISELLNFWIS